MSNFTNPFLVQNNQKGNTSLLGKINLNNFHRKSKLDDTLQTTTVKYDKYESFCWWQ